MKKTRMCVAVAALLALGLGSAVAQQKLGDLVSEAGFDWMAGKWVAYSDEGTKIELEYKWALDKHAIMMDFKMGEFRYQALAIYVASRQEVIHIGADNQGGTWKGAWDAEADAAVLRLEQTKVDGEVEKADVVHAKVDAKTMKVTMYGVDASGYRALNPAAVLDFKRQAKQSSAK